jgi:hypothetical protein
MISEIEIPDGWSLQDAECNIFEAIEIDNVVTKGNTLVEGIDPTTENISLVPWDLVECTFINNEAKEGLTPGFWRNNAQNWDATAWPEHPETLFKGGVDKYGNDWGDVFGNPAENYVLKFNTNFDAWDRNTPMKPTLFGAIAAEGGDVNALARHCVAAKLNAEHPEIDYPISTQSVFDQCRDALNSGDVSQMNTLKDQLASWNEAGADIEGGQNNDQGNNWEQNTQSLALRN